MSSIAFDSLTAARQLREKGIPQEHAEAIADAIRVSKDTDASHLATKEELNTFKSEFKADLKQLELSLKAEISGLRAETKADKAEIIKWVAAVLLVQVLMPLVQGILPLLKAH